MVSRTSARNQSQKNIGETVEGRVVSASSGLYTVPAGKTTKVTSITMVLDAVGGDATYAVAITVSGTRRPVGQMVPADGTVSTFSGEIILQAGDKVTNTGDNGSSNGTCDMTCTFIEL